LNDARHFTNPPFGFPSRYRTAEELVRKKIRTFTTTSIGRLFDCAAALLGFTREITFEGQAAMWLEQLARNSPVTDPYGFPFVGHEMDFRPLLQSLIQDRLHGREPGAIARAFQRGIACGIRDSVTAISSAKRIDTVVLSGGVFQNELLMEDLKELLAPARVTIWTNHAVPANDGGVSLGQAALAALGPSQMKN
jgi:hydrogenase maturation protein HypF